MTKQFEQAYDNFLAGCDVDTTMLDCAEFMFNAGRESVGQSEPVQPAGAQSWEPDEEACKFLADMITADPDQITRVGFHLGYAKDDDGNLVHGFSVYEAEYPEEGVHTLVETKPEPAAAINEQMLKALKACDWHSLDLPEFVRTEVEAAIAEAEKARGRV